MIEAAGATTAGQLSERLRGRRAEIEQTLLTRVHAVSDPRGVGDPEYALGLRTAVGVALDYALDSLDAGEARRPLPPPELIDQARAAARNGISLDTVLRRYFAGYTLLTDCLVREARVGQVGLVETMRALAALFDRLVATVTAAYSVEASERLNTARRRHVERIGQLLRGELAEASELDYPFLGWHLGILASGLRASEAIRELAGRVECRPLLAQPSGDVIWAWLGSHRPLDPGWLLAEGHPQAAIALGEPAEGMVGWRATHRQAVAALPVALRGKENAVRYGDVALLAASLRDAVLGDSLRGLYLAPLARKRDRGEALRQTLRAYLDAGGSASSAAIALGVNRNTVAARVRAAEEVIGRRLPGCAAELDVALRLAELRDPPS